MTEPLEERRQDALTYLHKAIAALSDGDCVEALLQALEAVEILYSMPTQPLPPLAVKQRTEGDGAP